MNSSALKHSSALRRALTRGASRVAVLGLISLSLSACRFDNTDLDNWKELDDKGASRLAGYALQAERPLESRKRAFEHLVEMRKFDHLLSLLDQLPEEERDRKKTTWQHQAATFANVVTCYYGGGTSI
jgi:hypothetical protein